MRRLSKLVAACALGAWAVMGLAQDTPPSSKAVLDAAAAKAKTTGKSIFLKFDASW
jgi:hypothetical protein